jgi:hypothetical protein
MAAKQGLEVPPPPGFGDRIRVMGQTLHLRYFRSLREKTSLDAYLCPDQREIWVATWRRKPLAIADAIWHEALHWMLFSARREKDAYILSEGVEEAIVSVLEGGNSGLAQSNKWFWKLYA